MTTTHAAALARLDGARAAHTHDEAVCVMLENALHRHPVTCGLHHVLGLAECQGYDDALKVLGVSS